MKHGLRNVLMISFLAVAGIFGVTSTLIKKQIEETPVVEKAEAAGDHVIYYATTTQRDNYYTHEKYDNAAGVGDKGFHGLSEVGKCGDYYIYKATTYEKYGGLHGLWVRHGEGAENGAWDATLIYYDITNMTSSSVYENKVWLDGWKNIYTITYNPNGGSGSTKTDYKIEGVDYTILSFASAGISSHEYKHAHKWSTNTTGTGTDYQPNASYDSDADLTLYFIETWYTYQFAINGGSWNTLEKTGDTPDGYVAKFSTTYSFTTGDTVTFQKYYGTETPISITPSSYELNIKTGGVIYYSATTYIDLKLTSTNGHTIKVGGFSERGIVIVRGGTESKCGCSEDSSTQWHINNITLLPGDTLKATHNAGTSYEVYVENTDVYGITTAGVVSTPGVYNIFLKKNQYNEWKNIYLSMDDAATAKLIAQQFNKALATVCASTVAGGATSQITSAFSTHSNYYNHLTELCQAAVKSTSTDADVIAMRAKYDYIVGKYGTTIAPDYLERNPAPVGAIKTFSQFSLFDNPEENLSTIVVIAASSIALISIASLSILIIKKKKSKEE